MWKILTVVLVIASSLTFNLYNKKSEITNVSDLRNLCWMIKYNSSNGSSVMKTRKLDNGDYVHFLWTAAHVIEDTQTIKRQIDPKTGLPKVYINYPDVEAIRFIYENGTHVGTVSYFAEVIRYSEQYNGEDLALLKLRKRNISTDSVKFSYGQLVPPGTDLVHIGSMWGDDAPMAYSDGKASLSGLWRHGRPYDHIFLPILRGCSGGPVFSKKDNMCVGIVTEATFGFGGITSPSTFIRPTRVIREFATRTNCLWAIDDTIPVPEVDNTPVTDIPIAELRVLFTEK